MDFLERYADRQKVWETILQNKLENFYSDLSWHYNTNPHLSLFKTIDI